MADLIDLPSWKLETGDLIQQLAMLAWLNKGEEGKELYNMITTGRVAYELWNRLSGQRELELYQNMCIMSIAEYVKKHPKATEKELTEEVTKQIELFKERIEAL